MGCIYPYHSPIPISEELFLPSFLFVKESIDPIFKVKLSFPKKPYTLRFLKSKTRLKKKKKKKTY